MKYTIISAPKKTLFGGVYDISDDELDAAINENRAILYENLYVAGPLKDNILFDNKLNYKYAEKIYIRKNIIGSREISIIDVAFYKRYVTINPHMISNCFYLIFDSKSEAMKYKLMD